ncbi:hypothetical protein [Clostridium uliginosum]|uniref:Uncharacterized protein n=1 Tax=Clostridium uliginosum TaxID=119641 RepID=A0A1I1R2X0_9CLOT|nr:hypothetical protein [Clostridium uliginosum]SFD28655.1 hypothetical protein SAMN05421842_12954 [Clostridium uliginosum]
MKLDEVDLIQSRTSHCDTTQTNQIEVKYIHPVYGCNPVYIKYEGNLIKGFSDCTLCFQATLY